MEGVRQERFDKGWFSYFATYNPGPSIVFSIRKWLFGPNRRSFNLHQWQIWLNMPLGPTKGGCGHGGQFWSEKVYNVFPKRPPLGNTRTWPKSLHFRIFFKLCNCNK